MQASSSKSDLIRELEKQVLSLGGLKKPGGNQRIDTGLKELEEAFPYGSFPTGAIHEFLSSTGEDAAASNGFIAGLLSCLMKEDGAALWISTKRFIFPPALKLFGIRPERIIFIDVTHPREALWAIEEALKCEVLSAAIGELPEISFAESRRLQLAVEKSNVTGFIHRVSSKNENTIACVSRWKISPLPGEMGGMPGLGFPRWQADLLKVRNGRPGSWQISWEEGGFRQLTPATVFTVPSISTRKAG